MGTEPTSEVFDNLINTQFEDLDKESDPQQGDPETGSEFSLHLGPISDGLGFDPEDFWQPLFNAPWP